MDQLGIDGSNKIPKEMNLVIAQLAFANSDLAFQGTHLFQGNFYGMNIFDISNPAKYNIADVDGLSRRAGGCFGLQEFDVHVG